MKNTVFLFLLGGLLSACSLKEHKINPEEIKEEAWNTVKTINRLWAITEDLDSLALYLHNDMALFHPEGKTVGKDKIIDDYRGYCQYAETVSMVETEPTVQLYNEEKTAIVSYYNDLTIKTPDGSVQAFHCKDMYTLIYEKNRWVAVAQHYSFYSK